MKAISSILLFLTAYYRPVSRTHAYPVKLTKSEKNQRVAGIMDYGKWCGPGHGGYQDCCDGGPCSSCNLNDGKPSQDCLKECPPIDELDYQCALHDECCLNNELNIDCVPEGNYCACDCLLSEGADKASDCNNIYCESYRSILLYVFDDTLSCWYNNVNDTATCNSVVSKDYQIDSFCNNGQECNPWESIYIN